MKFTLFSYLFSMITLFSVFSYSQNNTSISGYVKGQRSESLPGINVFLKDKGIGVATDNKGYFNITNLLPGKYTLIVSGIAYKTIEKSIDLAKNQQLKIDFTLQENALEMGTVLVKGKSEAEKLRQKGFSVSVVESKQQKNFTTDLNQVIKTTPGINLREAGGFGSGFKLSLNGLSGNQIRYFIDGIPMENFGSALTLNNYPINLIDKLEIYKGVVPVSLGSDALGGAINIVTDFWQNSFMDAAYSYGSFNTHRISFNGQYANSDKGFFLKGAVFYNHSDNNYDMEKVPVYDLSLGNYKGDIKVERSHDQYTSQMIHLEAGLFNKSFADKISVRFTYAGSRKNYQHPDNNLKRVFGKFHTKNKTYLFSATYNKKISNVDIKGYAVVGEIKESVIDTSSVKYNWAGETLQREPDNPKGELFERRSLFEFTDFVVRSNIGVVYSLSDQHSVSASFTQNYLERKGEDKVDEFRKSFESPSDINKNMLGVAYTFKNMGAGLEATFFGKQYWYSGKIITQDYENKDVTTEPKLDNTGYGLAVSYNVYENLQLKGSFEKAYRIPESFEILGDGIYVNPNPNLKPESSDNLNLGMRFNREFNLLGIKSEVNYFYRYSRDFIRFNPLGPFGEYENLNNVQTSGIEGSAEVNYRDLISVNTNVTYQNLTDATEKDEGLPNTNYKSRIPNVPYLFGNVRVGYSPSDKFSVNKLSFYWSCRYVHEFFLTWEKLGNVEGKNIIPSQFTQDLQVEYSMEEGKYNFSFSVNNIFDKLVYDNFSIQKPGRSFSAKFRYFLK